MICGARKKYGEHMLKVKHMTFERVNSFVYLGSLITADNNIFVEINNRITLANKSYFELMNLLKAKNMSRKHKVTMYKTLIKPVLGYGAETWVMRRADELRLGVFERKIEGFMDPSVKRIPGDQGTMMNCIIYTVRLIW